MMTIIILVVIYILSVLQTHRFLRIAYSKNARWSGLDTDYGDLIITALPLLNTIFAIGFLFLSPYEWKKEEGASNFNKFFKIKK